jgi:hypothetical protein
VAGPDICHAAIAGLRPYRLRDRLAALGARIVVGHNIEYLRRAQRHDTPPLIAHPGARSLPKRMDRQAKSPLQRVEWVSVTNIFAAATRHRSRTTCKFLHIPVA